LIFVVLALFVILFDGLIDEIVPVDLIVVPGNKVELDGQPSPWLRARLDTAVKVYRMGDTKAILVSGGVGKEGYAEAEVMRDYLIASGVPSDNIWVDNFGADTWLTAKHASDLMRAQNWTRAMVVSQFYHIPRAKIALRRMGIGKVVGVHAQGFFIRDIPGLFRELAGIPYYVVRPLD
jgi:vancomycin permeability regulator SanA